VKLNEDSHIVDVFIVSGNSVNERTGDVENADLAEDCAVCERREHRRPVVSNHAQLPSLDDVQLLADVTLAADVVAGAER